MTLFSDMTNRRDLIDDALLRPGRLDVQVEIGLPDKDGRFDILKIHTAHMRKHTTRLVMVWISIC